MAGAKLVDGRSGARVSTIAAMTRRALVVCTANVCRSPVVEQMLTRRLDGLVDLDGQPWVVTSAGIAGGLDPVDPDTTKVAAEYELDLDAHRSRRLDESIVREDGADLVITMSRDHLRAVAGISPAAWPRTFTLKEIVRRSLAVSAPAGDVAGWLDSVTAGRRAADLLRPDPADDVQDPYHRGERAMRAMFQEVDRLVGDLVHLGPWRLSDPGSDAVEV